MKMISGRRLNPKGGEANYFRGDIRYHRSIFLYNEFNLREFGIVQFEPRGLWCIIPASPEDDWSWEIQEMPLRNVLTRLRLGV